MHAAGESSPGNLAEGTYAVVLITPNETELCTVADRLEKAGIKLVRIHEPDAPYAGALMALGLVPRRKGELRKHLSSLPLLK